jgi:hypothetical protein
LFQYKTNICFKLKHLLHLTNEKRTQFASTIKNRTSRHTTKVFNRACKADPKEKLFLKNFQRFKKNKTPDTQARQKSTRQMTVTDDIKMVVTHDRQRTPAYNTGLAKVAVQCSVTAQPRWLIKVWFSASISVEPRW